VLSGGKLIEGNFFEPTILVDVPKTLLWPRKKPSAHWRRCSASKTKPK
jgi:succinate-semialdehyde dehydrogenase/glutarate-semialdehyde dehydrogenase